MALFQKSVLKKHLNDLNKEAVAAAYQKFKTNFANATKQANIREAKEEQYQEGFLRDLFVDVLGYTLNPQPGFNLTTEYKNEKDSKKADGAVLQEGIALAVIELKGTDTVDLDSVEPQAFGYKNNQKGCRYIIISNFEKLRFYIEDSVEHIEFDLFNLEEEQFRLLYICLQKDKLLSNLPFSIKEASVNEERDVTKKLYNDYSNFKRKLYQSICALNPQYDKPLVYRKTQKLLDRFLFILFAEDKQLLPPNLVREILTTWETLKELDRAIPLYDRYKQYFGYLNTGHKNNLHDIFAYNGGLFAPDEVLDNIQVDDALLYEGTFALSQYDFETEVDVNILGHIFEHSLNDVDAVTAEAEGKQLEKDKTRRKKDGVFYTPKYITKYIVENTVGKLCTEKKAALEIKDEDYAGGKKKKDQKALNAKLEQYRQWLMQLTILDPACGSGAFLNQALDFLIAEHYKIDELFAKLTGASIILSEYENHVLENNLYGVDLNEESIEIAKLSLWLRTAKKGRKLSALNNNIKCGNSLIDDITVAGDKAFNWQLQFADVFAKGGFDVVIGNPPYVSHDRVDGKEFLKKTYVTYEAFADLFCYFYEIGINILKDNGRLSFITSNSFLKADYGKPLRELFIKATNIIELINIEDTQIFSDATVNSIIVSLEKNKAVKKGEALIVNAVFNSSGSFLNFIDLNKFYYQQSDFDNKAWNLSKPDKVKLRNKISANRKSLEDYNTKIRLGLATGSNDAFIIDAEKRKSLIAEDANSVDLIKPILRGRDISRYYYEFPDLYILLTKNGVDVEKDYPAIFKHLDSFGEDFKHRGAKGQHWTNLRACSFFDDFVLEKIIWIELTDIGRFSLCTEEIYLLNSAYFLLAPKQFKANYLLAILNSTLMKFYLQEIANTSGVGTTRWINIYVKDFPIQEIAIEQQLIYVEKVDLIAKLLKQLRLQQSQFLQLLQSKVAIDKPSNKLQDWYMYEFKDFLAELKKAKIKLSLADEAEWMDYFNQQRSKALALKTEIDKTDKEIDQLVYKLYELTPEEIKIVEGN